MKISNYLFKLLLLSLLIGSSSSLLAQSNSSQTETTYTGRQAYEMLMKNICGTLDEGVVRYGQWEGKAYSRVPGEKDRHLFNVVGLNTRQCGKVNDPIKGEGFKSVSKEFMLYLDPKTNEILDLWTNPWSGKEIDVVHVANDPVNMRGVMYEKDDKGEYARSTTLRDYGDLVASSSEIPLFYTNPLAGEYQAYVGGAYHAMEIFNTFWYKKEMLDSKVRTISQSNLSWSRVAQWLPWMEMGARPGIMIFNTTGFSTFDLDKVWQVSKDAVKNRFPGYLDPPIKGDTRPNETSWTVFEKFMKDKKKLDVRQQGVEGHKN